MGVPLMRRAIFYWEAKRRIELLTTFRKRIEDYYARAHWDIYSHEWEEDEEAREIRRQINEEMRDVAVAAHFVGVDTNIFYTPPPATGGPAGNMALLENIFNLPNLGLSHTQLLDRLDRAIGVYRSWLRPLWRKLFNPFYWLGWGLTWFAEIPFRLLASVGFNTAKLEGSFWGKTAKAVIQFITAVGAALGVLEKLDLLRPVVSGVHRLLGG